MRKLIIYTLSILFAFQSAMAADFTVTGKMKGLTNGSTATLKNVFVGFPVKNILLFPTETIFNNPPAI